MSDNTSTIAEALTETELLPTDNSNRRTYLLVLLYVVAALLIGVALHWPATTQAAQNTYIVTNTNDSGAGSLRDAITQADAVGWASTNHSVPQYITFQLPTLPATIRLNSALPVISPTIIITGPVSPAGGVTVDAGGQFKVFFVEGYGNGRKGNLTLYNLTIANGYDNFGGGGVFNHGATLNLYNCTVRDNRGGARGAAIFNDLGYTNMYNTTVYSNVVLHAQGGTGAEGGGALYNHPNWSGYPSVVTIVNSTIVSNIVIPQVATDGGNGGGIFNDGGTVYLKNSVIAKNSAPGGYGPDFRNLVNSLGNNFIGNGRAGAADGTESSGWQATDQVGSNASPLDPLLGNFGNNGGPNFTMLPQRGSPLIDAGDATPVGGVTLTTDQRGLPRNKDGNDDSSTQPDIGAVEAQLQVLLNSGLITYVATSPPVLLNGSATVIDPAATSWSNRTIVVTVSNNGTSDDQLGINNQGDNPGQIGVSGGQINYGGAPLAIYMGGNGSPLQITFIADVSSPAALPAVQALLTNLTFSSTNVGAGSRTVQFALNTPNGNSSAPVSRTVTLSLAGSATSLVSASNPSSTGQSVTFTATVSPVAPGTGSPTGTVSLKNGSSTLDTQTLNGGNAVFSVPFSQTGSYTLTAVYNGSAGFAPSSSANFVQKVSCAYQVTLTTDDGLGTTCGTLSYALNQAAAETVPVTITLNASGPISFTGPMPVVTPAQGGYITIAGPCTSLNGRGTPGAGLVAGNGAGDVGLTLTSNMALSGVTMTGFSSYAVAIQGDNNGLNCSWLGTTDGLSSAPNSGNGVHLIGSNNVLGSPNQPTSGNLIAGNSGVGLKLEATSRGNMLYYNWFGLQKDGTSSLANVGGNVHMTLGSQLLYRTGNFLRT